VIQRDIITSIKFSVAIAGMCLKRFLRKHTHRNPCVKYDSNPRSQCFSALDRAATGTGSGGMFPVLMSAAGDWLPLAIAVIPMVRLLIRYFRAVVMKLRSHPHVTVP
jgi:hypothetical protein